MEGGSREARWKAHRGGKKKSDCRLVISVFMIRRCKFRRYDSVRGRCVSGLKFDLEGGFVRIGNWNRRSLYL